MQRNVDPPVSKFKRQRGWQTIVGQMREGRNGATRAAHNHETTLQSAPRPKADDLIQFPPHLSVCR
jgi:hypothetical protein